MFKKLVDSRKASLIAIAILFVLFALYAFLGMGTGKNWHNDLYTLYTRGGGYGFIYVPAAGLLLIIETMFTLCFDYEKLSFKAFRIISIIFYFLIFGVLLTQTIVYGYNILSVEPYETLQPSGPITFVVMVLASLFALLLLVFNFFCLLVTPNDVQKKKAINSSANAAQKLRTLKELFDQGVITEEEYNEKKQKYIDLL